MTKETLDKIKNPWQMVAYLFRYRTKEILIFLCMTLLAIILVTNVKYDKQNGFQLVPWKVEIKKEPTLPAQ